MTTTAHEDQFTAEPEPVRQPYDTGSILRRNVADLEIALKQQTERAEAAEEKLTTAREDMQSWIDSRNGWMERAGAAEAELERLREQKPVAWDCGGSITANSGYAEWFSRKDHGAAVPLYTSHVPAPAVPKASEQHVCGLQGFGNSLDDVCPACQNRALLQSAGGGK